MVVRDIGVMSLSCLEEDRRDYDDGVGVGGQGAGGGGCVHYDGGCWGDGDRWKEVAIVV